MPVVTLLKELKGYKGEVILFENSYTNDPQYINNSLKVMGLEYVDLILLHQPFSDYYGAYRAIERLYEEGKVESIGISNFSADRLVDLCGFCKIKPMVKPS